MSQNLRLIVASVTLIVFGALLDHFVISKTSSEKVNIDSITEQLAACSQVENDFSDFKLKFSTVTEEDIREYLRGQSADEKLRKADEILAKMMKIFIADLGLKISEQEMKGFGNPPTCAPVDTQPKAALAAAPQIAPTPTPQRDMKKRNVQFHLINNEDEAKSFVTSQSAADFSATLKSSSNLTREQARQLNGRYSGQITFPDHREIQKIELSFSGHIREDKLYGNSKVMIYDKTGKVISNSSGEGRLDEQYQVSDGAYLVQAGSAYLQLFYFPALDQIRGFFRENLKGDFKPTGTIILNRI